jgi:hypothetical protein
MFGGAEMTGGNLQGPAQKQLIGVLTTFSDVLRQSCAAAGLGAGQIPFVRPANFVSVLNPDAIRLVVDDISIGGIPNHVYLDRRAENELISLDDIVGLSRRDLGFRNPVGISLSLDLLTANEQLCRILLISVVAPLTEKLRERNQVQNMKLPSGYEHLDRFLPAFLHDHPQVESNVFLMMRFRSEPQYAEVHKAIVDGLAAYGLNVIRADDKDYTGDLWDNVCVCMIGCRFGIAVFEEIDVREFNPNVALELGFMFAHGKRCLLLKDRRMPRMPTDVIGKLYKEFDTYSISASIQLALDNWARDLGVARTCKR